MPESRADKELKELMDMLNSKAFSNSARLGIMIALYYERKMTFMELVNFSSLPKSSLLFHLQVLEEEGYVKVSKVFTIAGIRTEVMITDKGIDVMKKYLKYVKDLKEREEL